MAPESPPARGTPDMSSGVTSLDLKTPLLEIDEKECAPASDNNESGPSPSAREFPPLRELLARRARLLFVWCVPFTVGSYYIIFWPIGGDFSSTPDSNDASWKYYSLWHAMYLCSALLATQLQIWILLKPAHLSWATVMGFNVFWLVPTTLSYIAIGTKVASAASLLADMWTTLIPAFMFGLELWRMPETPHAELPSQLQAVASFDWFGRQRSLVKGFVAVWVANLLLGYGAYIWLELLDHYIMKRVGIGQNKGLTGEFARLTLIFCIARVFFVKIWSLWGRALDNAGFEDKKGTMECVNKWSCEVQQALFFRMLFVKIHTWDTFAAALGASVIFQGTMLITQLSAWYSNRFLPFAFSCCGAQYKGSRQEHWSQVHVDVFTSKFADILAGVMVLMVVPVARISNNRAFFDLPDLNDAAEDGCSLLDMYVVLLVVDVCLGLMKTALLHSSGWVGQGEAAVEAVESTWHWCILLGLATLHYAGDVTLGFVDVELH